MDKYKEGPQYRLKFDDKILLLNKRKFKLLEYIDECGSIKKASKKEDIPYRSAQKYIEQLEKEVNKSIVSTQRGGKGGGGKSKLTRSGKSILREYSKVESILNMHEVLWCNPLLEDSKNRLISDIISENDIDDAAARLERFAPILLGLFLLHGSKTALSNRL